MATSIEQIASMLQAEKLDYGFFHRDEREFLRVAFQTKKYVNAEGKKELEILIESQLDGECLYLYIPHAFSVSEGNLSAASCTAGIVQWRTRYVQFEFDHQDGEIRPCIEVPLADAKLTRAQLMACIGALIAVVEDHAAILRHSCESGKIDFSLYEAPESEDDLVVERLATMLSEFTPEQVEAALAARHRGRG